MKNNPVGLDPRNPFGTLPQNMVCSGIEIPEKRCFFRTARIAEDDRRKKLRGSFQLFFEFSFYITNVTNLNCHYGFFDTNLF